MRPRRAWRTKPPAAWALGRPMISALESRRLAACVL
jgi:ribosome-associated protein